MNKSLKEKGSNLFIQARRRSPGVFIKFKKKKGSQTKLLSNIKRGAKKWGNYVLMWNILEERVFIMEMWKNS